MKNVRILCILQLCLAFTCLLSLLGRPFLSDLYTLRTQIKEHAFVMGLFNGKESHEELAVLKRNKEKYDSLPEHTKSMITTNYHFIQTEVQRSFFSKILLSFHRLLFDTNPFLLFWIFISIALSVMQLKSKEGASGALWLLPLLCFLSLWDTSLNSKSVQGIPLPTEAHLINTYLKRPLSKELYKQQEELKMAWNLYLVTEWAKETPKKDPASFKRQLEAGVFSFELARLLTPKGNDGGFFGTFLLALWSSAFAFTCGYFERREQKLERFGKWEQIT